MLLLRLLVILFLAPFIASCEKKNTEELVIVTTPDNPPYAFIDEGKIVGLDIDVANAIGYHLGKKVIIKPVEFHKIFSEIASGNADMAIAGLSVTQDRTTRVNFSDVYTTATVAVLYNKDDDITEELDLKGKMIGVKLGTVLGQVAQDLAIRLDARVKTLRSNDLLLSELNQRVIDVAIVEEHYAEVVAAKDEKLSFFVLEDLSSDFAIAFPKDSELQNKIDNAIRVLETEGVLDDIRQKWLRKDIFKKRTRTKTQEQ